MAFRPDTYRASSLKRRDALLDAAIALIGERGTSTLTHRAIAAKAGVPLATTSYFFSSIDELIVAATLRVTDKAISDLKVLWMQLNNEKNNLNVFIEKALDVLFVESESATITQFEAYLEAARRPVLRDAMIRVFDNFEDLVLSSLNEMGISKSRELAITIVALIDGFALHRLATQKGSEHKKILQQAISVLIANM